MSARWPPRRGVTSLVALVLALSGTLYWGAPSGAAGFSGYANAVLADSPLAYYRLGDAPGSTTMTDSTGNGHGGTYSGGVTLGGPSAIGGAPDTSASFSGADDASVSGITAPTTAYTLEAWIRRADNSDGAIVGQLGAGQLLVRNDQLVLNQTGDDVVGFALTPGVWYHVAATWDGSRTRVYVDGDAISSTTANTAPSGAGTFTIGSGDQAPPFYGDIDEVAYYPYALGNPWAHTSLGNDATAPVINVVTPTVNAEYVLHATPSPSYSCSDPLTGAPAYASGVQSCSDDFSGSLGPHLFTIDAVDRAGNTSTTSRHYSVLPNRYADEVLLSSPLAYYRLGDATGAVTMTDSSGHGRDAAYRNAVAPGGHRPAAISCERRPDPPRVCHLAADPRDFSTHFGGGGYAYLQGLAAPTTAYTLEAWVRRDDAGDGSILGQGGAGQLFVRNGHLGLRQTQDDVLGGGPALTPGTWWHVAATWDGSTTRLFVNGTQVASSATARKAPSGSATMYVGFGEQAPSFSGDLDEVAYYPTALSGGVLAEHYAVGTVDDWASLPGSDTTPPTSRISSPTEGALYSAEAKTLPHPPLAVWSCHDADGGADVVSCTATVDGNPIGSGAPLPLTPGTHDFAVLAEDAAGLTSTTHHHYSVVPFAQIFLADAPLAYYRLGDAGSVMADASGHGHDGTYRNLQESGPVGISGDGDHARRFWGDGGYGSADNITAGGSQSTLEAWVNPDDGRVASIAGLAGTDELLVTGGRFAFRHLDRLVVADVGPTPGQFRQVVGVWDGATVRIYVDGELHGTAEAATGHSSGGGTFYVGNGTLAPWFKGSLDEVAYYDTALSPDRILQHFLADPPPAAGPRTAVSCRVPDLRGLRLAKSRTALTHAGCRLGPVRHRAAGTGRGRVLSQSVAAGRTVVAGRRIAVTVGR